MFDKIEYELLIKKFERENSIKYSHAFLNTYNDIVENGYNISML